MSSNTTLYIFLGWSLMCLTVVAWKLLFCLQSVVGESARSKDRRELGQQQMIQRLLEWKDSDKSTQDATMQIHAQERMHEIQQMTQIAKDAIPKPDVKLKAASQKMISGEKAMSPYK